MQGFPIRFLAELPEQGQLLLDCSHDPWLVLLSYAIATGGSLCTLIITQHLQQVQRRSMRLAWGLVGGLCLAGGIWSMHFIGMLAFQAPVAIAYDLATTLLSLLVALAAALLALYCMAMPNPGLSRQLLAAVIIGLGISAMHYSGMAAIRSPAEAYYQGDLFALSVGIAISASFAALLLNRYVQHGAPRHQHWLRLCAALVMGAAIASMHYTGMASLNLVVPEGTPLQLRSADNAGQLVLIVASITLLILGLSLAAAWAGRKLDDKERDLQRVNNLLMQLDQAKASLEQVAHFDPLTELLNRRGFNRVFAATLEEHAITGRSLAVMFLDVDHFKRVNDTLGHDAGDELLRVVAQRIRGSLRERDIIARFGGDEFCVVASLDSNAAPRVLAQRILEQMKEPISLTGRRIVMTTSVGISLFPQDGNSAEELLKHADLALYQSKGSGRNVVHFFNPHLKQKASFELQLEEDLRQALQQDNGLMLFYQPIIDLRSGALSKLEALVRWHHPLHGLLTPERFIAIAEANGFIDQLDDWVLRRACHDLNSLEHMGYPGLKIAVNCSALNLANDQLPGRIEQHLQATRCPAQCLELEVTESALLSNINRAIGLLERIRALGVCLSIDDFGTGYSSLAYLRRLPLDTLKIDRSFIQDLANSNQDREIVHAIIAMAHALHLKVVAEGVETGEQLAFLQDRGCDQVQGYLFSKPLPLEEIVSRFPPHVRPLERVGMRL
ncbi:EAL domain-containing protein [Pseudomonas sp. KHPS1]|uniref:putative bifunctional diguanylate cyclase/phosphodiesterase n=1 Tax=Ectopseudomonas hydrolytica TaxID=2493633 RepID=UPI0010FC1DF4|nr:EAL domain-containing protein [Pseudomonas sp. KHPS1]ARS49998.1 diguanylate phosphodiesterase [Pseudomonas mendocina]UTH35228.1 EAL domain-containing protein [Pseudomonas sp. KHPS1]